MRKVLYLIAMLVLVFTTSGMADAYMSYSFEGKVQSGSGYQMGSDYAGNPLFVPGDKVKVTINFDHATNQLLAVNFTAGTYHHSMTDFSGYTVSNFSQNGGPVFNYDAGTNKMIQADMRFKESSDNYPYGFIKYVDGSGSTSDYWFVFNTYTNNDTKKGFSLNTFTYTTADRLAFTDASAVPVPGAVWLLGSGLAGLIAARKRLGA